MRDGHLLLAQVLLLMGHIVPVRSDSRRLGPLSQDWRDMSLHL